MAFATNAFKTSLSIDGVTLLNNHNGKVQEPIAKLVEATKQVIVKRKS